MPEDLREFHRFLSIGEEIAASKAILGSFSVAHLTCYSDGTSYRVENESGLDFFYGSNRNQFWQWYKRYLDSRIDPNKRESIVTSLKVNKIAITDLISSCERKGYSALDTSLTNITWNVSGIKRLLDGQVNTFLCTSKWVMQKLQANILKKAGYQVNQSASGRLQRAIFPFLNNSSLSKPVAEVYQGFDKQILMIALPTPGGGTYRTLDAFGYNPQLNLTANEFIHLYLEMSFQYFTELSITKINL